MASIRRALLLLCSVLVPAVAAAGAQGQPSTDPPAPPAGAAAAAPDSPAPDAAVLADVDGEPITEADVRQAGGAAYARLQEQLYAMRRQRLSELVDQKLLAREAARRGTSVEALLEAEVSAKAAVPEAQAREYVAAHPAEFAASSKAEERVAQALLRLGRQRQRELRQAFLGELRSRALVREHLRPPEPYRAPVPEAGGRVRGPASAPVTIVEFSDYHCPFCRQVQPVLARVRAAYKDEVRLVYRDFPLDATHPEARRAAEAARCAAEQGRFWEFHDALYRAAAAASDAALERLAAEAQLDGAALLGCLASGRQANGVDADAAAGRSVGVDRTPTFFVNGRRLDGAPSFERLAGLIEEELARARKP